jgi:hypothetical protein
VPLTQNEVEAALLDPEIFIHEHCWLRPAEGGLPQRFHLWDSQRPVIRTFDEQQRVIILKARQLGISWLADAYALWLCIANKGQTVLIISKGLEEAKEELARIRFMYNRLPPELKRVKGSPDRADRMEFLDMDSRVISLPATEDAGTSYTATLVIVQELAKIDNADGVMTAVPPTLSGGGKLFVIFTAKGYHGVAYQMWKNAAPRMTMVDPPPLEEGDYYPVFIPWTAHPKRDQQWYTAMGRTMTDRKMQQEYPATPEEAFQLAGSAAFEEFDSSKHTVDGTRHPNSPYMLAGGLDPGLHHAVSYVFEIQGRNCFVFAETHVENGVVKDLGDKTVENLRRLEIDPENVEMFYDPAAMSRNMQTGRPDTEVLEECGLYLPEQTTRFRPSERTDLIKTMLKNGRLWISLDCPYLIDALGRAEWARQGKNGPPLDTYRKDGLWEHPLDALGEGLIRAFAGGQAAAVETERSEYA